MYRDKTGVMFVLCPGQWQAHLAPQRRVVMVWLKSNTEPVSERDVTTDRCHTLVGPYIPHVRGMLGIEMTREEEWCFCFRQNSV